MQATEFQNASDARAVPVDFRFRPHPRLHRSAACGSCPSAAALRRVASGEFLGGWQLNGTVIRQSGAPLGFGNALFIGNIKDIPLPKDQRTPDQWFNTDAGFNKVSAQQLANNMQTFPIRFSGVRADGQSTWNFSLFKNFKLAEKAVAQFRAEVYNTMNHPSFDVPNTTPTNSSFGAVDGGGVGAAELAVRAEGDVLENFVTQG